MRTPVLSLTLVLAVAGCQTEKSAPPPAETKTAAVEAPAAKVGKGESPDQRDVADPDGVVRRGEALSDAKAISVDEAYQNAQALAGKTVKVQGTVATVCAAKGCWFELKGEGEHGLRITAKDYRFFVPSKAPGMVATIEGALDVKDLDQATAQHYEDDKAEGTGQPAKKVEGPVAEIGVAAVGLEMRAQGG